MTTSAPSSTSPDPDARSGSESADLDHELEQQGHGAAPEPETIETASGERVPQPDEQGFVAERHRHDADRLDHPGDQH